MNFDFSEDQKLLQHTAKEFLSENSPLSVCREILESEAPYSQSLWKGAAELGWLGTAVPEEYGGAGFGYLELAVIAEEVGRALAPIPFSSSVYLATEAVLLAGSEDQKRRLLPAFVNGESIGTLAISEKPGQNEVAAVSARCEGGKLTGVKLPVPDGDIADVAIVAANGGKGVSLYVVSLTGDGVTRESLKTLDLSRSAARISFDGAPAELLGEEGNGVAIAEAVLDRAAVLLAFEQLGGTQRAFDITKEFTLGRYAFGRPIASFQAIKHRLADLWCEIELARSNCYYGAWALSNDDPELGEAACLARIQASRAFDLAGVEMVELHGGVGYTWEYDCHMFYRRAKSTAVALGSPATWREKLIRRLEAKNAA
jgi:alkylation response protein AidB-like acyl-CoA dehydrogenase